MPTTPARRALEASQLIARVGPNVGASLKGNASRTVLAAEVRGGLRDAVPALLPFVAAIAIGNSALPFGECTQVCRRKTGHDVITRGGGDSRH